MDRKNFLMRRRLQYMGILMLVFLLLFVIFDLIVYTRADAALYEEIDGRMLEAGDRVRGNADAAVESFLRGDNIIYYESGESYVINYLVFVLVRDDAGRILNAEHLYAFDYLLNVGFSAGNDGHLVTESAQRNGFSLYYRIDTVRVETGEGNVYYVQLVTDSSEIEESLRIILNVLVTCTVAAMLLVLVAGWYLSKTLVRGVAEAWEKQDEFISYASHEIRSPLAVIHSSLELLLETPGARIIERSELIMNSLSESSRLRKMTSNLLEMVQLQANEMQLNRESLDLRELIEDFIEPFVYQAESTGKRLDYTLAPDVRVSADRQLITELLAILLENALKYTEDEGEIRLEVFRRGGDAVLRMSDNGVGIGDEAMDKIFTRFYREKRQQTRTDGSGLGLYIASLIVERHGGRIRAEHNLPRGTVFTVSLPAE